MNAKSPCRAALLLAAALVAVSGCSALDYEYEPADVRDVMKGVVPSAADRYRIERPEIPVARKNLGIVREGGLFVLISSPGLKNTLAQYPGEDVEFGVHFRREPRKHLVLERLWVDGDEIDLFADVESFRYGLPDLVTSTEIDFAAYDQDAHLCEVEPDNETKLASVIQTNVYLAEFHVRTAGMPEPLKGTELVAASHRPADRKQYFLSSEGADYLVTNGDAMTLLMLDYLLAEEREFQGGVEVGGIFDAQSRTATRVAGTADIRWISLGGPLYYQAR